MSSKKDLLQAFEKWWKFERKNLAGSPYDAYLAGFREGVERARACVEKAHDDAPPHEEPYWPLLDDAIRALLPKEDSDV